MHNFIQLKKKKKKYSKLLLMLPVEKTEDEEK